MERVYEKIGTRAYEKCLNGRVRLRDSERE